MNTTVEELWTISDIAEYLKMSTSTIYKNWKKLGVHPIVAYPGAKPRFQKSAVIKAVAMMKIIFIVLMVSPQLFAENLTASYYSVQSLKEEGTFKYSKGVMANGQLFSDYGLTAASRDYPLGTKVKVTRIDTGASVVVVVTDRCNKRFARKRIDLSYEAMRRIDGVRKGLVPVQVTEVI